MSRLLLPCRCCSLLWHLPSPRSPAWGWPSCLPALHSFVSFVISSQRARGGGRGGRTVIIRVSGSNLCTLGKDSEIGAPLVGVSHLTGFLSYLHPLGPAAGNICLS